MPSTIGGKFSTTNHANGAIHPATRNLGEEMFRLGLLPGARAKLPRLQSNPLEKQRQLSAAIGEAMDTEIRTISGIKDHVAARNDRSQGSFVIGEQSWLSEAIEEAMDTEIHTMMDHAAERNDTSQESCVIGEYFIPMAGDMENTAGENDGYPESFVIVEHPIQTSDGMDNTAGGNDRSQERLEHPIQASEGMDHTVGVNEVDNAAGGNDRSQESFVIVEHPILARENERQDEQGWEIIGTNLEEGYPQDAPGENFEIVRKRRAWWDWNGRKAQPKGRFGCVQQTPIDSYIHPHERQRQQKQQRPSRLNVRNLLRKLFTRKGSRKIR